MGSSYKEKIKNAYLLFYERVQHFDEAQFQKAQEPPKREESKEEKEENSDSILKAKITESSNPVPEEEDFTKNYPQDFLQQLVEKNQVFHMRKYVFSKEYIDFITEMIMQREFTPNLVYSESYQISATKHPKEHHDLELIKLGVIVILTTILRDNGRYGVVKLLPFIKKQLSQNVPACLWLLQEFSSHKLQAEFFFDCPVGVSSYINLFYFLRICEDLPLELSVLLSKLPMNMKEKAKPTDWMNATLRPISQPPTLPISSTAALLTSSSQELTAVNTQNSSRSSVKLLHVAPRLLFTSSRRE